MMSFLFLKLRRGVLEVRRSFLQVVNQLNMNRKTDVVELKVTIRMVYPILVRVRTYVRCRFGKQEHVRAHYRRYWGV